jgi:hypothetical protein
LSIVDITDVYVKIKDLVYKYSQIKSQLPAPISAPIGPIPGIQVDPDKVPFIKKHPS